jgi:hypothetical protein
MASLAGLRTAAGEIIIATSINKFLIDQLDRE